MFKKKKIFITGGTTGLGEELAIRYLQMGHSVAVCGRDEKKWKESRLFSSGQGQFYIADVCNKEEVSKALKDFMSKDNLPLDLFIANAGIGNPDKVAMPNFSGTVKVIQANVLGVIYSAEAAFEYFHKQQFGHFITISSMAGLNGLPGNGGYSASKSAVIKLSESFAIDWKKFNITVTTILPGFVDTPLTRKNKHFMPFLMTLEKAGDLMIKAIESKTHYYAFPWTTYTLVKILSLLPRNLYIKLMSIKLMQLIKNKES